MEFKGDSSEGSGKKKKMGAVEKTYFVLEDTYIIMSLEMQMLKELLMRFQLEMRKMLLESGAEEISKWYIDDAACFFLAAYGKI